MKEYSRLGYVVSKWLLSPLSRHQSIDLHLCLKRAQLTQSETETDDHYRSPHLPNTFPRPSFNRIHQTYSAGLLAWDELNTVAHIVMEDRTQLILQLDAAILGNNICGDFDADVEY